MLRALILAGLIAINALTLARPALADTNGQISFADKQITMVIGFAPGGGTDVVGRFLATYFSQHLPGRPSVIVRNIPGADGMTAMNFVVQQTAPDGLTIVMGSSSQVDPMNYRKVNAKYDPTKFPVIGGVGRGGSVLLIDKAAEPRLYDKSLTPLNVGSTAALPRNAMQMALWGIEYLGWNAKWVVGYRGTNEVVGALERGEVDMTATGNIFQIQKLVGSGKFGILTQSGGLEDGKFVPRPDFGDAPVFPNQVRGKITDPEAKQAFEYWTSLMNTEKWLGLTPKTSDRIVQVYRHVFEAAASDPAFLEQGKKISEDFTPQPAKDVEMLIKTLANTSPGALEYTAKLMRKQGLRVP